MLLVFFDRKFIDDCISLTTLVTMAIAIFLFFGNIYCMHLYLHIVSCLVAVIEVMNMKIQQLQQSQQASQMVGTTKA